MSVYKKISSFSFWFFSFLVFRPSNGFVISEPLVALSHLCILYPKKIFSLTCIYRVFKLDMTYFEVQDGRLKLTSMFKKGSSTFGRLGHLTFSIFFQKSNIGWPNHRIFIHFLRLQQPNV